MQCEGHSIFPGSTGENVTIVGLDWSLVETGLRLKLGDDVAIEVTRYVTPCQAIRESFAGHGLNRISWRTNRGWSRAYACVLQPGKIAIGDIVRPLP
ncbi:MAG: MOSC domain-containing protein [Anaerolineales bacterium]|uniref:MOSC domain-containing protein n=1 Tax=Promineifilum sp. TaxID=2664178 RepID=UPI001D300652|nr:MOSC domain-containing protein [Anaerolineales bacterium]MCB8936468.1 MOSC domain-containing protein [Promineifilum sp.]MCO5178599.1 MOSC domain-containing protein [Promineifilum sp.]